MPFTRTLLGWYAEHRRELPWRDISDPYRIWVSEIILQQTRVEQGRDYYARFVSTLPTVEALAAADEDTVMRLWQGLGYYSRARNLHEAARQIVRQGGFPRTYAEVLALKGVGAYTAAAICSFAFGLPCAAVDGNVYRVLSRYFGISEPIDTTDGKKTFARLAGKLLPAGRSADFNQALMDFGALQCVPRSPECDECPLEASCAARAEGRVDDYPVKSKRTAVKERFFVLVRVETPQGIWLHRRTKGDIWAGLYEFPLLEFDARPDFATLTAHPFVKDLPQDGTWNVLGEDMKHVLTHRIIRADAYTLSFKYNVMPPEGFIAVKPGDTDRYAMPRLLLSIEDRAKAHHSQQKPIDYGSKEKTASPDRKH